MRSVEAVAYMGAPSPRGNYASTLGWSTVCDQRTGGARPPL